MTENRRISQNTAGHHRTL